MLLYAYRAPKYHLLNTKSSPSARHIDGEESIFAVLTLAILSKNILQLFIVQTALVRRSSSP